VLVVREHVVKSDMKRPSGRFDEFIDDPTYGLLAPDLGSGSIPNGIIRELVDEAFKVSAVDGGIRSANRLFIGVRHPPNRRTAEPSMQHLGQRGLRRWRIRGDPAGPRFSGPKGLRQLVSLP
jgi:hypothetical protein